MLIIEHIKLKFQNSLVKTEKVNLDLFAHESGQLVLASNLKYPQGMAYYVTSDSLLNLFFSGTITLQALFDMSPSFFIEIVNEGETRLYLRFDVDIILESGEKTLGEITGSDK